jgi:uncharacterized protein YdaU (DUF1376 family)
MNYYEHHLGDYVRDTAHLSLLQDGAYHRLLAAYYIRERALPTEHDQCFKLARCKNVSERKAVLAVLKEFFRLEPDGYHQKRADEQIAEYQDGEPDREQKRENDKERKRRSRERRRALFADLRAHGITPHFDSSMADLEAQLSRVRSRVTNGNSETGVTRDQPVTGRGQDADRTATQSHPPIPSPNVSNPLPPFEKGATPRNRRSQRRSEADEALKAWSELVASGGVYRDDRVKEAVAAIGGYSRIRMRTEFEEPKIRKEFVEAYVSVHV